MTAPAMTILLCSHMKGPYLREAINSVLAQTSQDLQLLVVDSGQWRGEPGEAAAAMARIWRTYRTHPLVEWTFTGEGPDLKATKCPVGWATNQAIRRGLVRGRYMATFYDDDRYLPQFVEVMAGYLDRFPQVGAVWCSQLVATLDADGVETMVAARPATEQKFGASFDCQVDGAQVAWRTSLLDQIGDPWLPEEPSTCYHSDGIFLDKLGAVCGVVPPIPEVLVVHRFTPLSAYTPVQAIEYEGLTRIGQ
jgi:hypothetical protein